MRAESVDGSLVTLREATADVDTRPATLGYFTTGRVDGSDGYTAATLTPSGESIVTWAAAGRLLSLTGHVPTSVLLAISRSVRLADDESVAQPGRGLHARAVRPDTEDAPQHADRPSDPLLMALQQRDLVHGRIHSWL